MKYLIRIIRYCLKSLALTVGLAVMILSSFSGILAQGITISGQVKDKSGESIPGVNILIKGTTQGVVTGIDGDFALVVPSTDAILVLSYIGYVQLEMKVGDQTVFNIVLSPDIRNLQEVVVTALGVEKDKKSLGYSVQEVKGQSLEKAREPNIISSLTGKVAGLEIRNSTDLFRDPAILLRGAVPLIVIDGIPNTDADLWKVNADDIESLSVLKGATASALYGSIGRNGAIMITTKRGGKNGIKVDINSSTMFQPGFIRIPKVQSTYGNGNNGMYEYTDGSGSGLEGGGWIWGPRLDQKDPSTPSGFWETTQFDSPIDPGTGQRIPTPFISRGKNNVRNFFQTGMLLTNNVSVTGGNENGNFRVSASNVYQKGLVPNTELINTSFTVSGGYKFAKNLKTDASLTYNKQNSDNYPEIYYGPQNYLYNLVLWTGPDIDIRDMRDYWVKGKEGVQQKNYNNSWYNNPYFQAYEFLNGYYKDNTFGQVTLNYTLLPGLELTARSGFNFYTLDRSEKEPKSYIRYDVVSRGNYNLFNTNNFNINSDIIARYTKEFNKNLKITASVGGANRYNNFRSQSLYTDGLVVPQFYNIGNSANAVKGSNRLEEEKVNSVYGTIDVELLSSVFLGITGRNDWVSTLPVQNNSFFYPSVSLAAVISDIIKLPSTISFLKLRGSWSRVSDGRIRISSDPLNPYNHIEAYSTGINWNNNPSLYFPGIRLNPNISPETSDTYEMGMDLRLLEGRVGIDATYYNVRDYNNITFIPVSSTSGYTSRLENGNEYLRKGIEIVLSGTPVKAGKFTWNMVLNWSTLRKTLKSVFEGATELDKIKVGERTDQIYDWQYARTPGGQLIYETNGFPAWNPFRTHVGNSDPDWIFGMQNTFNYGNFSFDFSVDGRVGGVMWSTTNQKMWWGGTDPGTVNAYREAANRGEATFVGQGVTIVEGSAEYDNDGNIIMDTRVYAPNVTKVNYISWNETTSNAYLNHYYSTTFLKLREVALTYKFPSALLKKISMENISVSLVGRNLLLWSDMPNVDPDPGYDGLQTPSARNIGFNINLTF